MPGNDKGNPMEVGESSEAFTENDASLAEGMSRSETPKLDFAILSLALLGLLMIPAIREMLQGWCILVLLVAVVSALLVALGTIEDFLASRNYLEFRSFMYTCGLFVALVAYWARMKALDDVNAIFHVDPGPLPMTVWAATALNLISVLLVLFFFAASIATLLPTRQTQPKEMPTAPRKSISIIKRWEDAIIESTAWEKLTAQASATSRWNIPKRLWILAQIGQIRFRRRCRKIREGMPDTNLWWSRFNHRRKGKARNIMSIAVFTMSLIGWLYAYGQLNKDARRQKLYMIALSTDFNSNYECAEFNSTGKVGLFIGPDQGKILLAPEYNEVPDRTRPFLIGTQKIPSRFPVLRCTPPQINLEDWEHENNVKSETQKKPARIEPL